MDVYLIVSNGLIIFRLPLAFTVMVGLVLIPLNSSVYGLAVATHPFGETTFIFDTVHFAAENESCFVPFTGFVNLLLLSS